MSAALARPTVSIPFRAEVREMVRGDHDWGDMRTAEQWHPATIVHFTDPTRIRIPTGRRDRHRDHNGWGSFYDVVEESGVPVKAIAVLDDGRVWDVSLSRIRALLDGEPA